uniref:Desmocollin 2 like n=1 Tax=Amphiprion percula TaxID=161767 RepID=A0A3P8S6G4_AMPPE
MANVFIFNICLLWIMSGVESCSVPSSLHVLVPKTIEPEHEISRVDVSDCTGFSTSDPSFSVTANGLIVASASAAVTAEGRTFSVWAQHNNGLRSEMKVHLVYNTLKESHTGQGFLKRFKRRWSPPPFNILENDKGPYPKDIETIVSDSEATHNVYYTCSGPGVNEYPANVFSLNSRSGMLTVHQPVDREQFPVFRILVSVFDSNTHQPTDLPLPIEIKVDDVNDNAPEFAGPLQFTVQERCSAGTVIGKVIATDRDEPGSRHVLIKYILLTGSDLFNIDGATGVITAATNTLDREVKDKHLVTVQIKDMGGDANCLSSTATATIQLTDINDNPPTFTKASYDVSVPENEGEKLILRIPVEDKDLINTPNWISKFVITKGNENGNFRIDTDPKTNEGLLYVTKPLDYELNKNIKLEISAQNEAELNGTTAKWMSIPVEVAVTNVDEGPQFSAPTVRFIVKENTPNGTLIGTYTAVDPETKSSNGIKYYKTSDPASWITVDKNTGELRVANTIDRESQFVKDGIYNITVKAVDASSKTGTGTVIIQVDDVNDNVPQLPTEDLVLCEKEGALGSVIVVAEDKDQPPLSSPFTFALPSDNDGKWSVSRLNDTAGTLQQMKELPTGIYQVPMMVTDLQGYGREQTVNVRICQCRNGVCLAKDRSMSLGGLGVLALLLPLALLLLLFLLLAFFCLTRAEKVHLDDAGDSGGILLKSNTEAPGDEVDSSLIVPPFETAAKGDVKNTMLNAAWPGNKSSSTIGANSIHENGIYKGGISTTNMQEFYSGQYDSQYDAQYGGQYGGQLLGSGVNFDNRQFAQDAAFLQTWQTNGRYLNQKLGYLGTEEDRRYADDIIHSYGYEGAGSAAGSVGCCSDNGETDNLDFLNTLGPKFKTLADVCRKS